MNSIDMTQTRSFATLRSELNEYFAMTKPTVSLLVVITAIPGALLASNGNVPNLSSLLAILVGTFMASGSGAILNQLLEGDVDQNMKRTRNRPLVVGRANPYVAWFLSVSMGFLSIVTLAAFGSPLAAAVALFGSAFYVLVYTLWLKPRTVHNIVIGGAAGSVGPLIGAAAVSGDINLVAWLMAGLIFLWTPAHFWALALHYKEDYARASIPMLPVVRGDEVTRKYQLAYALTLLPTVAGICWFGGLSLLSWVVCGGLTVAFSVASYRLYASHRNDSAMKVFYFSCIYLLVVFAVFAADGLFTVVG